MAITAKQVQALREKTGLPMMDCKNALTEAGGDETGAIEILRKKGLARVEKMATRETTEGRIGVYGDSAAKRAAVVEVRCETAPVAKTDDFIALSNMVAQVAAGLDNPTPDAVKAAPRPDKPGESVGDFMNEVFNRIRENMQIARVATIHGEFGTYLHHDAQTGVLVEFSGPCPDELKSGVCMHIAALRPPALKREDVDAASVAAERERFAAEAQGKPPEIAERMINGKLDKWYSEFVLLEQPYVRDDKKSVAQALKEASPNLTINRFLRFRVGETGGQ